MSLIRRQARKRSACRLVLMFFFLLLVKLISSALADQEFQLALPGWNFAFPRDHASHPQFKTEWWYYTGHLSSIQGEPFSYQLTFFRVGVRQPDPRSRSAWALNTIYFAHFALTDINRRKFTFHEKTGRGALGMSGAAIDHYKVWIDDWQAELEGETHHLQASAGGMALDLKLTPGKPPVIHGKNGVSQKAAGLGNASHYYSLTRLATAGQLTYQGQTFPVQGTSWMDHEFSSSQLAPYQTGWDWFSLQLDDGQDLMLYVLRHLDGSADPHSSGTLVGPQGNSQHLKLSEFTVQPLKKWQSPRSKAVYPSGWKLTLPQQGYELELYPTIPDQELATSQSSQITYWEGSVRVSGSRHGQPVQGRGYVELTGYAEKLGGKF